MSAPKSFRASVQQAAEVDKPVPFVITDDHGKPDDEDQFTTYEFEAVRPSSGLMLLLAATDFSDDQRSHESVQIMFDFLGGVIGDDGRRQIERLLARNVLDMEGISEIIRWIVEQFGDFPTQPPSDSSPTPERTGTRSTGRQRKPGSTPSTSPSTDS